MCQWIIFLYVLTFVVAMPSDKDECGLKCTGIEYECIDGGCFCKAGYINNYYQTGCVKCPDLGEKCFGVCCNTHNSVSLQCWHGICQPCFDSEGNWKCRDTIDQMILVSTTQVIMGTTLVLGIIATLVLLFKLCTTTSLRAFSGSSGEGRLSIGSLQMYVNQRLRDAPPRYTRSSPGNVATLHVTPVTNAATVPAAYHNSGFIHDANTIPPPPYAEAIKYENNQNTGHM